MRSGGTRKRPASEMSTSALNQIQGVSNHKNPSSPRTMQTPPQARMPYSHVPVNGLSEYGDLSNTLPAGTHPYHTSPSQKSPESSGIEVARAQANNQIVPIPNYANGYPMTKADLGGHPAPAENGYQSQGQYSDLDRRALLAQRDAQATRKPIPPFVQKLSSFLDENTRNTDLIRWSDSGDSFIVVDEDEFAKTLIPELFKHNNYASFVRQLNMYGFHKKVGLSDNSMRASERKNKHPSEYSHPYFKRGKPNLLWLIRKPKGAPAKGTGKTNNRAKQEDEQDVDDFLPRSTSVPPLYEQVEDSPETWHERRPLALPPVDPVDGKLPPEQFRSLQQEMAEIKRQQRKIADMLSMTRRENAQLYNQAKAFHELHEKHDNSINAILTFLATVYNKNMVDKGVDFRNMFATNTLPPKDDGHEVVDVGDDKPSPGSNTNRQPYMKRKPLLLKDKASPAQAADSPPNYNQWPPGTFSYTEKPKGSFLNSPTVQEIHDQTPSNRSSQSPQVIPEEASQEQVPGTDILSVIQNQNAQNHHLNGSQMNFPEVLSHLQNTDGQSPLTPVQRQNMLQLMSNEQANDPQNSNPNNSLTSYSPPDPAANLAYFNMNAEQLSQIEQSLREQEARMANMQATIAPLSPSGSIPGVNDQSYNANPELDLDSIFNSGDYFNDGSDPNNFDFSNGSAELPDFDFTNFGADAHGGDDQTKGLAPPLDGLDDDGRVKEMDSSEATSPANTVHTIDDEGQGEQSPRKKRRAG